MGRKRPNTAYGMGAVFPIGKYSQAFFYSQSTVNDLQNGDML